MKIFKKKEKKFINEEYKELYFKTKKLMLKDLFFSGFIMFGLGFLVYSSFEYIVKFAVAITIYIMMYIKESNSYIFQNNMLKLEKLKIIGEKNNDNKN